MQMEKEFKKLLRNQKNISNEIKNNIEYNDKFFATIHYQLNGLLLELHHFLKQYEFKNSKKEQAFFKNQMTELYADYWMCTELFNLYIQKPLLPEDLQQFFIASSKKYKNHKAKYAFEYAKYCCNDYGKDVDLFIKATWVNEQQTTLPNFMDPAHKHLFPSYMMALDRIIALIEQKVISNAAIPIQHSNLKWSGTKADFVILVYALKLSACFGTQNVSSSRIVRTLSKVFNIEVQNPQKIMADVKNRKNPELNILSELSDNFSNYIRKPYETVPKNKSLGNKPRL